MPEISVTGGGWSVTFTAFRLWSSGAAHCTGCGGRNFWRQSSVSTTRDEGQARDVGRLSALAHATGRPSTRPEVGIKDGLRPVPQSFAEEEHRLRVSAAHGA
jgi:hypothetical protein